MQEDVESLLAALLEMEISSDIDTNTKALQRALDEKLFTKQEILGRAVEFMLG